MSRSGYSDDHNGWETISWRGRVASATRGMRGQKFFVDLVNALDAMPDKRLISEQLQCSDGMCALGAVGAYRGIDLSDLNPNEYDEDTYKTEQVADALDIAGPLAMEVVYMNDEGHWKSETPEQRWIRIRAWAQSQVAYVFEDNEHE